LRSGSDLRAIVFAQILIRHQFKKNSFAEASKRIDALKEELGIE
jgi:hypothetical protein